MTKKLHLVHVKSNVPDKAPSASTINYGEIAVNYSADSPALYIRDNNDNIVKFISEPYFLKIVGTGVTENDGETITPLSEVVQQDGQVIAAALNDLNERIDNVTIDVDDHLDSASTNPVENRVLYQIITEDEEAITTGFNDLNNKIAVTGITETGSGNAVTGVTISSKTLSIERGQIGGGSGNVGSLSTTAETAQSTSGSESFGSNISLHKISKTGNYADLIDKPTVITGVTMNSAAKTVTNGVVDLGTVVTEQTSVSTGASGNGNVLTNITLGGTNNHALTLVKGVTIPSWATASTKPSYTASEVGALASSATLDDVPDGAARKLSNYVSGVTVNSAAKTVTNGVVDLGTVVTAQTQLSTGTTQGSGNVVTSLAVSDHQITLTKDVTIPAWATASTKPSYTASEVGALESSATLDNVPDGTTRKLSNYVSGVTINSAAKTVTNGVVDLGTVVTAQTQLSTGATQGSGNVVTSLAVSDHQITLTKGVTIHEWATASTKPSYTANEVGAMANSATLDNVPDGTTRKLSNYLSGATMNGTAKSVTNGVVDLGTVLTSETSVSTGTSGSGNVLTNVTLGGTNNHTLTLVKGATIPEWATASTKPSYTASEVGAMPNNATLDNVPDGTARKLSNYISGATMNGSAVTVNNGNLSLGTVVTAQTQLSTGATQGSGNVVTSLAVNNHQITLTKGMTIPAWATASTKPSYTASEVGAVSSTTFNTHTGTTVASRTSSQMHLPTVSASDNGKILRVVNGAWELVDPATIYYGSGTPAQSLGNDGDIYIQTS